ncbi:hypothetical protein DAPPUDRAFT_98098 [Daphnia pulex]|uniref:Uncharacterized protein n=1 Tax=Daphnia pulex TaxID=6669 RepID=E9G2B4_DAPPU|nr:hypothetical protein DAPPUDRAFT_98098 [Daphnia pulex]|eukprot:EFX86217.1 hypothetical protein DAPPUDRAFT_98098 [Daphnia pulex]
MCLYIYQICLMNVKCLTEFVSQKHHHLSPCYYKLLPEKLHTPAVTHHRIKPRARSFFMESCRPGTEILVPMLAFVHERRVTLRPVTTQQEVAGHSQSRGITQPSTAVADPPRSILVVP